MPESYKGLTLNEYLDDEPDPNRPGQRENRNFKAVIDAITTDSVNPSNITLPQRKTAIYSSTGITKTINFEIDIPIDSLVTILSANPIAPSPSGTGVDGFLRVMTASVSTGFASECFCYFFVATTCGIIQGFVIDFASSATPPWQGYDTGMGSEDLCFVASPGYSGSPATIKFINRTFMSDLFLMGSLTYKIHDVA